jgi:hypothetical protein
VRVNGIGAAADSHVCGCATDASMLITGLCGSALGARCFGTYVLEKVHLLSHPAQAALEVWTIASQVW